MVNYPTYASFLSHEANHISVNNYKKTRYESHSILRRKGWHTTTKTRTPRVHMPDRRERSSTVTIDKKEYARLKLSNLFVKYCINKEDKKTAGTSSSSVQDSNMPITRMKGSIETISDLIDMARKYGEKTDVRYNLDVDILLKIMPTLKKIKNVVGMDSIKQHLFHQIIFYLQHLQTDQDSMLHTVIEGPPGMGKTMLAEIMAELYSKMGLLKKEKVTVARRSDMVGAYLGQTAIKTQKVLDSSIGGVLLIDEAYSLGNREQKDSYAKECIDTINRFLSEHKHEVICIVVGYKASLQQCFFAYNSGLERRFPYRLSIPTYSDQELVDIFLRKAAATWTMQDGSLTKDDIHTHRHLFKNNGGDMENLLFVVKIEHAKRLLQQKDSIRHTITRSDISLSIDNLAKKDEESTVEKTGKDIAYMYS